MCPVLNRLMYDAMSLVPCAHTLSEEALARQIKDTQPICAVCDLWLRTFVSNRLVRRMVEGMVLSK